MKNFVVYRDNKKYCSFPSLCSVGSYLYCIFRVEEKILSKTHINTRSYALLNRSSDCGETWEVVSKVRSVFPKSGIQDPAISVDLITGSLFLSYYVWRGKKTHSRELNDVTMQGIFLQVSRDEGISWEDAFHLPGMFREQLASRCPLVFLNNDLGTQIWCILGYGDTGGGGLTSFAVLSNDEGKSWEVGKLAHDSSGEIDFTEPWIVDAGMGHLICLVRAEEITNSLYQVHSWDGGRSWETPRKTLIKGYPASLIALKDGRILSTYGVRANPYGVRACLSWDGGISWDVQNEINIRLDGGGWDLGYPQTIQLADGSLLTVYYFYTKDDSIRHIQCTRWEL